MAGKFQSTRMVRRICRGIPHPLCSLWMQCQSYSNALQTKICWCGGSILQRETAAQKEEAVEQLDLFSLSSTSQEKRAEEEKKLVRERKRQEAMLAIKRKYGKNAILKGMNLQEGATAKDRNGKIGGHKA